MKCYICNTSDIKINMQKGKIIYTLLSLPDFMPNKYQYFHRQCLQSVICDPQDYSEETVNCALECHDYIMLQKENERRAGIRKETDKKILGRRLGDAQRHLECYDEETNSV